MRRRPLRGVVAAAAVLIAGGAGAVPARAADPPRTLADRGIATTAVQGPDVVASVFVPIPAGFSVAGGTVDLRFAHSALLLPERSTITLLADDVPLASARLGPDNAAGGRLRARLPRLTGARGGIALTARFTMRLTRDRCEDPRNSALWAKVLPESVVVPQLAPADRTLGFALADLVPAASGGLRFDLPPAPSAAQLEAAGRVAAAVGRTAAQSGADPIVADPITTDGGGEDPSVRVTTLDGTGGGAGAATPAAGAGVLSVTATGPPALLLGGGDARGVTRAADTLATPGLTPLAGRTATVTDRPPAAPAKARPWRKGAASFAQLGIGSREIAGPGAASVDLAVDRPPDWTVNGGAVLHLVLDAAAGLQARGSQVTAIVGGQPVGSRPLQPGRGPVTLDFPLPANVADTDLQGRALRTLPISLNFQLQPDTEGCTSVDTSGLRVRILDRSSISLPHDSTDIRDLSRFPSPLGRGGAPIAIVVPQAASAAEVTTGLQLAAAVGRWQSAATVALPRLVRGNRQTASARRASDLILVGGAARELGLATALPGGPLGADTGGLVLRRARGGRTALVVLGDDSGLMRAARALTRAATNRRLVGSAVRVAPSADPQAVRGGSEQARLPGVLIPEAGAQGDDHPERWAIPAGVALVALLLITGLVVRRRWWGQGAG